MKAKSMQLRIQESRSRGFLAKCYPPLPNTLTENGSREVLNRLYYKNLENCF